MILMRCCFRAQSPQPQQGMELANISTIAGVGNSSEVPSSSNLDTTTLTEISLVEEVTTMSLSKRTPWVQCKKVRQALGMHMSAYELKSNKHLLADLCAKTDSGDLQEVRLFWKRAKATFQATNQKAKSGYIKRVAARYLECRGSALTSAAQSNNSDAAAILRKLNFITNPANTRFADGLRTGVRGRNTESNNPLP